MDYRDVRQRFKDERSILEHISKIEAINYLNPQIKQDSGGCYLFVVSKSKRIGIVSIANSEVNIWESSRDIEDKVQLSDPDCFNKIAKVILEFWECNKRFK